MGGSHRGEVENTDEQRQRPRDCACNRTLSYAVKVERGGVGGSCRWAYEVGHPFSALFTDVRISLMVICPS
jgi:hypothetical protein